MRSLWLRACVVAVGVAASVGSAWAQSPLSGDRLSIARLAGPVAIDGDISEEAWRTARRVDRWVRDQPRRQRRAAGQERRLPRLRRQVLLRRLRVRRSGSGGDPRAARRPRQRAGSATDYGGVILDTRNDGRTGRSSCCATRAASSTTPITDDAVGRGLVARLLLGRGGADHRRRAGRSRSACRSRRCATATADPQTWGILLYRNYPRDFRYQFFSTRLPRGGNCFICSSSTLTGLAGPARAAGTSSSAPYATAHAVAERPRRAGHAARRRDQSRREPASTSSGRPFADDGIDATINPDFSQIESDAGADRGQRALRAVLPREAAVLPRGRRPLLDADPGRLHAHHHLAALGRARHRQARRQSATRRSSPRTGRRQRRSCPGPAAPDFADQDFGSLVGVGRACGATSGSRSSACSPPTARSTAAATTGCSAPTSSGAPGRGRPSPASLLFSAARTPNRPDLAERVGRPGPARPRGRSWLAATHDATWTGSRRDRTRRRLPRRQRLRAAGRLPRGLRRGRLHVRPKGFAAAPAHLRQPTARPTARAMC